MRYFYDGAEWPPHQLHSALSGLTPPWPYLILYLLLHTASPWPYLPATSITPAPEVPYLNFDYANIRVSKHSDLQYFSSALQLSSKLTLTAIEEHARWIPWRAFKHHPQELSTCWPSSSPFVTQHITLIALPYTSSITIFPHAQQRTALDKHSRRFLRLHPTSYTKHPSPQSLQHNATHSLTQHYTKHRSSTQTHRTQTTTPFTNFAPNIFIHSTKLYNKAFATFVSLSSTSKQLYLPPTRQTFAHSISTSPTSSHSTRCQSHLTLGSAVSASHLYQLLTY